MKTTTTFIALLSVLFISNATYAQKHTSNKRGANYPSYSSSHSYSNSSSNWSGWSFGAELMLNKTTYSYNGTGYGSFSPGFFAVADYSLNRQCGFIFKLGYDNKQAGLEAGNITVGASIDYLNISSLFRFNVAEQFFLAAGPVLNFSLGKAKITVSDGTNNQTGTTDPSVSTRFGFTLETGYSIGMTNTISIVPTVGYDLFFTAATDDGNGSLNNLHLGTGIQVKL